MAAHCRHKWAPQPWHLCSCGHSCFPISWSGWFTVVLVWFAVVSVDGSVVVCCVLCCCVSWLFDVAACSSSSWGSLSLLMLSFLVLGRCDLSSYKSLVWAFIGCCLVLLWLIVVCYGWWSACCLLFCVHNPVHGFEVTYINTVSWSYISTYAYRIFWRWRDLCCSR